MLKLLLLLACITLVVSAGPIYVTGGGTFQYDGMDGTLAIHFSGSDGIHSVSVNAEVYPVMIDPQYGFTSGPPLYNSGTATVDGITGFWPVRPYHPLTYSFSVNGDSGGVAIWDNSHNLVAYELIAGYIQVTSFDDPGCCGAYYVRSGTFLINPTPEPRSFDVTTLLMGVLLLAGRVIRLRRRSSSKDAVT